MIFLACLAFVGMVGTEDQVRLRFIGGQPANITAASCASDDVQTAIDAALDGWIVGIPAGTCAWVGTFGAAPHGAVLMVNRKLWIRGAGKGVTNISVTNGASGLRAFTNRITAGGTAGNVWISDLSFVGTTPETAFIVSESIAYDAIPTIRFRFFNLEFNPSSDTDEGAGIQILGPHYGVVDHNIVTRWQSNNQWLRPDGYLTSESGGVPSGDIQGDLLWSQPLDLGGPNFLFAEDNVLPRPVTGGVLIMVDSGQGGARLVWRYNVSVGGIVFTHWTTGSHYGAYAALEVYNNTMTAGGAGSGLAYPIRIEGGTGVVYDNEFIGWNDDFLVLDERRGNGYVPQDVGASLFACDGTRTWDGNVGDAGAPGWPCLGQIGRTTGKTFAQITGGDHPGSQPLYIWDNPAITTLSFEPSGETYLRLTPHPNGDVDVVFNGGAPPGYAAYTYPHPCTTVTWPTAC